jgi:hypothetical protein
MALDSLQNVLQVSALRHNAKGYLVDEHKAVLAFMPSLLFPLRNSVRFIYQHDE